MSRFDCTMKILPLPPRRAAALAAALVAIFMAVAGQARIRQPNAEYAARRARLMAQMDGPVVLFGYTGKENTLEFLRFQQEENFYYLTGHNQEGAALVLVPAPPAGKGYSGPREILFLPAKNPGREKWNGPRMAPSDPGITETTGFAGVQPFSSLEHTVAQLAQSFPKIYTLLPGPNDTGFPHAQVWSDWLHKQAPGAKLDDVAQKIAGLRQVKSPGEIALLTRAVEVSVDAHLEAMRMMRPGLYEYQVAARMQFIHANQGCTEEAYAPIVGAGLNSTVLHYDSLENQIHDGDIVVLDVACAQDGYAADITRTLPANGHFSSRQREIYDIVLGAQNAALAAVKPGVSMSRNDANSPAGIAYDYINSHGKDREGRPLGRYYIHGLSHPIGLDVHDAGIIDRPLEPGMVITLEPGIYIPEEKLGVRIEDDVLVTETGAKVLSARLPRAADEVEAAMAQSRAAPVHPGGSPVAANEASALASLRLLNTACRTYSANYANGFPLKLSYLGSLDPRAAGQTGPTVANLIGNDLATGTKDGYAFFYSPSVSMGGLAVTYTIQANPVSPGQSGGRYFFTDQSGVIRSNPSQPAAKTDPPVQ
jgi:Xaa-Pro aminopeptidase